MAHLSAEAEDEPWPRIEILAELIFALPITYVKLTGTGFGQDCTQGSVPRIVSHAINLPRAPGNNSRFNIC